VEIHVHVVVLWFSAVRREPKQNAGANTATGVSALGGFVVLFGLALLAPQPAGVGVGRNPRGATFTDGVGAFAARLESVKVGAAVLGQRAPLIDREEFGRHWTLLLVSASVRLDTGGFALSAKVGQVARQFGNRFSQQNRALNPRTLGQVTLTAGL